jgi:hypothetical protein
MEELFSVLTQEEMAKITSTKGLRRAIDPNEIRYITTARSVKGRRISRSLVAQCRVGEMTFEELGQKIILPTCDLCWDNPRAYSKKDSVWDGHSTHPRCESCGVFFGGTHAGGKLPLPRFPWGLCEWCSKRQSKSFSSPTYE